MNIESLYKLYQQFPQVQTDTRKIKKNEIFFALKGENFNGNSFAKQALETGAAFVVADEQVGFEDERIVYVDDVLETLQQLAKYHREQFSVPFIAITGSNGKTTTKELVHAVLSTSFRTYTTEGNLNNHIGIPLTILKIKTDAQMAVIEMGANHQHEIEGYCEYAQPTHGLITNIGKAHLEGFGGEAGVKKGKGELFAYLHRAGGTAFVNSDDPAVLDLSLPLINKTFYGSKSTESKPVILKNDPFLEIEISDKSPFTIKTNLVGAYNLPNVLAAFCIGKYFGVDTQNIQAAIENYQPSNSRSQLIHRGSNTIILDAYNANPGSMQAAIENFAKLRAEKKVLMLGSMMELGNESRKEHESIIELIGRYSWNAVALVGKNFGEIKNSYYHFQTATEAGEWLRLQHFENVYILIKGSRSMKMEQVLGEK